VIGLTAGKPGPDQGIPERVHPRLPGGFHLPPFGVHQFLAAMIVCTALWAVGAMWLGIQAAAQWVGSWQQDIHLHVYLPQDRAASADALEKALAGIPEIAGVRRISAQEAGRWMQGWLGDVGLDARELVRRLPISFELSLGDHESEFLFDDIRDAASRFGAAVNEEEVSLAQVHGWVTDLGHVAWFASLILALAMALIISNTLRMTLLARADEIHLMRLMGAYEWFVRLPFILEGALIGAAAGALAWLLLWPVIWASAGWLELLEVQLSPWWLLLPMLLGGGLVGTLGAVIATMRIVSSDTPR